MKMQSVKTAKVKDPKPQTWTNAKVYVTLNNTTEAPGTASAGL